MSTQSCVSLNAPNGASTESMRLGERVLLPAGYPLWGDYGVMQA